MVAVAQKRNPAAMTMSQLAADLGPTVKLHLNKTFGFKDAFPKDYTVDGFANPSLFTPRKIPGFEHDPDFVTFMLLARKAKFSAYVHGMHGGGKTENVLQFCSVLNLPVQVVQCHRDITVDDLVGMMLPRPDGSFFGQRTITVEGAGCPGEGPGVHSLPISVTPADPPPPPPR